MLLLGTLLLTSSFLADCGPSVSPQTTQAIIQVESGGNALAIGDNTVRRSYAPTTIPDAVQLASRLISEGHSIDMGLMQINSCHIAPRHLSLHDLFDPCKNIRIGTTILAEYYQQHKSDNPAQSLFRALSAYNTGRSWKGTGYINKILKSAGADYRVLPPPQTEDKTSVRTLKEAAASSPLFFDNLSSSMKPGEM